MLLPPSSLHVLQSALQELQSQPAGLLLTAAALALLALSALRAAAGAAAFLYAYFLRPATNLKSYGAWAVVTGCTDGIGRAYAAELAKRGINLVLISRTEAKLAEVGAELAAKHGVQARHVAADLSQPTPEAMARIEAALQGLEVGLLVNNAGLSYDHPEYLDEVGEAQLRDMVALNALAPTLLARLVLRGMRERGRGAVVNIGSGAASVIPASPLLSAYAGTKAFVEGLSTSLAAEYGPLGVAVQNQAPLFVATKMSKIRVPRLDAPTPDAWAAAAARQVGREPSFSPYWFHGLQQALIRQLPAWLVTAQVLRMHQRLRATYYRRQARRQAEQAATAVADTPAGDDKRELRRRK